MLDLSEKAFIYAQALDNKGDPEYWIVNSSGTIDRLPLTDARLSSVREQLDTLMATGRHWGTSSASLGCRINRSGACVISIEPVTRDVDGRISPVIVLFNALGPERKLGVIALTRLQQLMSRELFDKDIKKIKRLEILLALPRCLLLSHIILFSRNSKK